MTTTSPDEAPVAVSNNTTASATSSDSMAPNPTSSTTISVDTTCYILDRIPAEIRNKIYELVLAAHHEVPVELRDAAPPSSTLLLTCRQIYTEAREMYRSAYRDYWTKNRFTLTFYSDTLPHEDSRSYCHLIENQLRDRDLSKITEMSIRPIKDREWTFSQGIWVPSVFGLQRSKAGMLMLVSLDKADTLRKAGFYVHEYALSKRVPQPCAVLFAGELMRNEFACAKELAGKTDLSSSGLMMLIQALVGPKDSTRN